MTQEISALDVRQQGFRRRFRGYDVTEVRRYLAEVAEAWEQVQRERDVALMEAQQARAAVQQQQAREQALRDAALAAQQSAKLARSQAEEEAQRLIADAQQEAQRVLQEAHRQVSRLQGEGGAVREQNVRLQEELRCLLNTHMRLLENRATQPAEDTPRAVSRKGVARLEPPVPPRPEALRAMRGESACDD